MFVCMCAQDTAENYIGIINFVDVVFPVYIF